MLRIKICFIKEDLQILAIIIKKMGLNEGRQLGDWGPIGKH